MKSRIFPYLFFLFLNVVAGKAEELKNPPKTLFSIEAVKQALKEAIDQVMPLATDYEVVLSTSSLKIEKETDEDTLLIKELKFETGTHHFQGYITTKQQEGNKSPQPIRGEIQLIVDIPVVKRVIYPEEEITPEDISWQKMPLAKVAPDIIQNKNEIIGKVVKGASLKPGLAIRKISLKAPVLIRKKDTVKIVYRDEGLMLGALGEAQQEGARGDFIRITLFNSKKDLQAQVIGKGQAEIQVIG